MDDLFEPSTKTLNANNEHNLVLSEQTLRAIDWQNQELDKQTKMIHQAGFQFSETASRIGENTSKINETLKEVVKETQDIAPVYVDTKKPNFFMTWGRKLILN